MPTVMFTAKGVLGLPAGEGGARADYWDRKVAGLVLRVSARARAYSVWYRVNGIPRRLTLETFADLAARYLDAARVGDGMKRGEALAPRTLAEYRRILNADVFPAIGGIAPAEVTKAHIRSFVDSIRSEGHAVHANRVLAVLKSVFSWAVRKDVIATSPCSGLQATREHPRERVSPRNRRGLAR